MHFDNRFEQRIETHTNKLISTTNETYQFSGLLTIVIAIARLCVDGMNACIELLIRIKWEFHQEIVEHASHSMQVSARRKFVCIEKWKWTYTRIRIRNFRSHWWACSISELYQPELGTLRWNHIEFRRNNNYDHAQGVQDISYCNRWEINDDLWSTQKKKNELKTCNCFWRLQMHFNNAPSHLLPLKAHSTPSVKIDYYFTHTRLG